MKVLVVAGAQNSGKTTTIGRNRHQGSKVKFTPEYGRTVFSHKGKLVCIYSGSCQELNEFCHYKDVIDCIKRRLEKAEKRGCSVLILPFTMWTRWGELNTKCIREPIGWLARGGHEIKLTCLQDDSVKGAEKMKELMGGLGAAEIKSQSRTGRVNELWEIFLKFDP